MKNIVLFTISFLFTVGMFANDSYKNLSEIAVQVAQEKPDKKAKKEKEYKQMASILENKQFVLEADYLSNQYGNRVPVTSTLNFIKVDSSESVIQVGSDSGIGYNGVGGVTADGRVTKYNLKKNDKKKTFYVQMTVMTTIGTYDVSMNVSANGYANASISGMRRGKLNYTGSIVPMQATRTYQGTSSY